jgi:hypothetical protein
MPSTTKEGGKSEGDGRVNRRASLLGFFVG